MLHAPVDIAAFYTFDAASGKVISEKIYYSYARFAMLDSKPANPARRSFSVPTVGK